MNFSQALAGPSAGLSERLEEEDDVPEVLYGYADLMIVGCIYYSGVAHRGEFVNLVREPNNRYDKNAIRVDNLTGTQVGHIKATQASCLARVLDRGSNAPRMEAVVSSGGTRIRSLPVRVHVYGPPEKANATVPALKGVSLKGGLTRQLGASSGGASSAGRAPRISVQTKAADSIKTQKELDEMFDKLDSDVPKKPTAETTSNVKAVLSSTLMAHQEQGLAWMVQREKNPDPTGLPPFWESRFEGGSRVFHNTITCSSTGRQPNSVHGGILADEMGLGKTLQVISLILANPPSGTDYASRVRAVEENQRQLEKLKEKMQEAPATVGTVEEVGGRGPTAIAAAETAPADAAKAAATSNEPTTEEMILATVKAYKKLKKGDLQASLKSKGLNDQGLKDELVTRLARSMTGLPPLEAVAKKPAAAGKVNSKGKGSAAAAGGGGSGGGGGAAGKGPLGTLVVCPMSVMGNWENQIQEHVKEGALKVYAYHGQSRSQDVDFLASCDVVVTTYDTLASDFNASGGEEAFSAAAAAASSQACRKRKRTHGLMSLGWHRVVLDEAHTIRNPKTGKHKACVALSARHRWCLTGTPLQNRPEDIGSLFTFLRLAPASTASVFKRAIGRPIQAGSKEGLTRLRVLMRSVCLRRNKRILGSNLPPKVVEVHSVEMDDSHREAYNVLYNSARAAFKAALAMGESEVMSQYASVLECLLRLRQVCCSRSMVPEGRLEQAHKVLNLVAKDGPKMRKEEARKLFDKLKGLLSQDEPAECAVCLEPVEAADARVLRGCGHGFCHKCLGNMCVVAGDGRGNSGRSNCPLCRATFTTADIMAGADLEKAGGGAGGQDGNGISNRAAAGGSAGVPGEMGAVGRTGGGKGKRKGKGKEVATPPPKVAALLSSLDGLRQLGSDDKVVIFSQFTSFLDVMQPLLVAEGYRIARIDGTMKNKQRQAAIKAFCGKEPGTSAQVMLASLTAAGTGINLTSANHCFICDPWWNASVEEQAMDRVHRIGQTKPVRVVRLVCTNSVENRILEIQEKKQTLGKGALRKLSADELRKTRMADLRSIFEC